jgi:hypothetical protein
MRARAQPVLFLWLLITETKPVTGCLRVREIDDDEGGACCGSSAAASGRY